MAEVDLIDLEAEYVRLLQSDPAVQMAEKLFRYGAFECEADSLKACIVAIASQRQELTSELRKLRSIAPRIIRGADGTLYRWDCPTNFIQPSN